MNEKYEKILFRPYRVSVVRARMSESDRAAQFAPYSALSGFEEEVCEEARMTETKSSLDDSEIERLDEILRHISECPEREVWITYFVYDEKKEGGAYRSKRGRIKNIDIYNGRIIFTDGEVVRINNITDAQLL